MINNNEQRILLARTLSKMGHASQTDKCGRPYFDHVERVAITGENASETIVGYLHDLVEDGHTSHGELNGLEVFSNEELEAVRLMDKCYPSKESYDESIYYSRIKHNDIARKVKLNDLKDNMNIKRFSDAGLEMTEKDFKRLEKYQKQFEFLLKKGDE